LRGKGSLKTVSVFETTAVLSSEPGVPAWNFVIATQIPQNANADSFVETIQKRKGCEAAPGVEVRRMEILRTAPNSNYARATAENDVKARESRVEYIVEYIAVKDTPEALNRYREMMRLNSGPAIGLLIRDGSQFNFLAMESVKVDYLQAGMPGWNQIHLNGSFPANGSEAGGRGMDAALRQINPANGGLKGVFGPLASYRTRPRIDRARQLFELAVR
jgi:hypothetical protein